MTRPRTPGNPLAQDFTLIPLLRFAFPTIATMLFMGLYTMTDTIFISRLVNTNALSAVNIVCPVINIMVGLGTMAATGGSAIIARRMGEGQERQAKQDFTLIVLFGAFLEFWSPSQAFSFWTISYGGWEPPTCCSLTVKIIYGFCYYLPQQACCRPCSRI